MSKTIEVIREKSIEILLAAIAGVLGYLVTIVWTELSAPFVEKVLPTLSNRSLLAIILIQFALLIVAAFWLSLLYRKFSKAVIPRNLDVALKYEFDKRLGIYRHKESGLYYCTSCLKSNIESPLKEEEHGWTCEIKSCSKFYRNPDYKEPPPVRVTRRGWVNDF